MIHIAYAATEGQIAAQCFVNNINDAILFPLITLLMALAFLMFLYGSFEYVRNSSSDQGRETGKQHILWGVVGMFIMLSAFSILSFAAGTFNLDLSNVDCSQLSDRENTAISTSPMQFVDTSGDMGVSSQPGSINSFVPGATITPQLPSPAIMSPVEPGNLLNPQPSADATVIDTVIPNPVFPVLDTYDDRSVVLDCGGDCYTTGVMQECTENYQGVISGIVSNVYDQANNHIVCSP